MLESRFCGSSRPTVGVELELQLVDARTLALQNGIDGLFAELPPILASSVRREFHTSCVEIGTDVCRNVDEIGHDLKVKLRGVTRAAAQCGMRLAWGGTHPFSLWKDQDVTDEPRYRALADVYRETLLRQLTYGLHVHVGVESGDGAIRACNRIRDYLPLLLALSANSPFWCGRATGLQSHRLEVMSSSPLGGIPPYLGDWASFLALVDQLATCGMIKSLKDLWWDVRPNPVLGTVEVRICDMPLGLEAVLGLTAIIECLVHILSREKMPRIAVSSRQESAGANASHAMNLQQNRWLASRYGLDAMMADPDTCQRVPVRVLARELIDRLIPVGRELDCADYLHMLRARSQGPTGADTQLATYSRSNAFTDVVRLMIRADTSGHWYHLLSSRLDASPLLDSTKATS